MQHLIPRNSPCRCVRLSHVWVAPVLPRDRHLLPDPVCLGNLGVRRIVDYLPCWVVWLPCFVFVCGERRRGCEIPREGQMGQLTCVHQYLEQVGHGFVRGRMVQGRRRYAYVCVCWMTRFFQTGWHQSSQVWATNAYSTAGYRCQREIHNHFFVLHRCRFCQQVRASSIQHSQVILPSLFSALLHSI